jgi:hypothetical protein
VHDITDLERRRVPAVFVASREFGEAAQIQSEALGFRPAWVLVEHPIQDRTDDEMCAIADGAVDSIVAALIGGEDGPGPR